MFVKWSSFATQKTELLLSINLLLCTSSRTERTLYERCVEHAWSDQNSAVKNQLD